MRRPTAAVAGALATGLIAAGCGGDDDETTSAAAPSDDFVAQVTAACDSAGQELDAQEGALVDAVASGDEDEINAAVEDELLPIFDGLVSDLEAIDPPADQAADYDELLAKLDESLDLLRDDPSAVYAAAQGESNEVTERAEQLERETDALAAQLGVPQDCGEGDAGATGPTGESAG